MTEKNIKQILDMLDNVHEKLLALPDDMLLRIDPRDNVSLKEGYEFISTYNDDLIQFSRISTSLKQTIEQQFSLSSEPSLHLLYQYFKKLKPIFARYAVSKQKWHFTIRFKKI